MRANRLFVSMNAGVLVLANLAVPFGLSTLADAHAGHVLFSLVLTLLVFFLAVDEKRWRFPWWGSMLLAAGVILLSFWAFDLESRGPFGNQGVYGNKQTLPLIYLFLALQAMLLIKMSGRRTGSDFWQEQGAGVVFVLFGCLTCKENVAFSLLLLLYIAAAVVCMLAFYFHHQQVAKAVCQGHVVVHPLRAGAEVPGRLRRGPLLFWGSIGVPLVLLLFFCTPHPDLTATSGNVEPFDCGMDMNATGRVKQSKGTAFTVVVTDGDTPVDNLGFAQRWRGEVFTRYYQGRWFVPRKEQASASWFDDSPPEPSPGQRTFDFTVLPRKAGGLILTEPVVTSANLHSTPVTFHYPNSFNPSHFHPRIAILRTEILDMTCTYSQFVPLAADPDRNPVVEPLPPAAAPEEYHVPTGIRVFTADLLRDFAEREMYGLTAADLEGDGDRPRDLAPRVSVRGERIARALTEYLHSSRVYTYTLDRPRYDKTIDPVEDFLVNVRQGHCERFAAALALMLRSQGIPARVVVGYNACAPQGNGTYRVSQEALHAWVEARVPPSGTAGLGLVAGGPATDYWLKDTSQSDWLSLDPTCPFTPPPPAWALPAWLSSVLNAIDAWWKGLGKGWQTNVLHYDANLQTDLLTWATDNLPYLVVAGVAGAMSIYLLRLLLSWVGFGAAAEHRAPEPFYQRLLELLAWRRGLEPQPQQTPREFGAAAAHVLQAEPSTLPVAAIPAWIVELYYRVRFGGRSLGDDEQRELEARLNDLKTGLK